MDEFKISEDIYMESLNKDNPLVISDDIYVESVSLEAESVNKEIEDSYHLSGRFWIWKMGNYSYRNDWIRMLKAGEMQVNALGLKYLKSYKSIADLVYDYEKAHPDRIGIRSLPPAYWAFANYLQKGDAVLACSTMSSFFAWGVVEGNYRFMVTRSKGKHFRAVSWHKMQMPFIFTNQISALFQIPKDETNNLKETLISRANKDLGHLPFDGMSKSNH